MGIILAQIFRIIGSVFSIISDKSNNMKKIFIFNSIGNFFNGISYFFIDAITGGIGNLIAILRNVIFYKYKDKVKISTLIVYFIITILLSIKSITEIISVIPIVLVIIYSCAIYTNKPIVIKYSVLVICLLEIIYDFVYHAYVGIVVCIIDITLILYNLLKTDEKAKFNAS